MNNMGSYTALLLAVICATVWIQAAEARSVSKLEQEASQDDQVSAVIPSPNQDLIDSATTSDIPRRVALNEAANQDGPLVPIYASPYMRPERDNQAPIQLQSDESPPNFAPISAASSQVNRRDLKASASYGHGHHGGHDHSGWLDMGAWTGGKGSFGWYADYPVGGKHHGYYAS